MLALYDLCAVLTPCGPLKMLVGLMQERNEPLPGLLYEANLPPPTDYSQPQQRRQHQENVAIPSPMSLGVGMGFGSWAIMMGTPGFNPPPDEEHSTGKSDQMSQASTDAGIDVETSGHGLLPALSNSSAIEPPVIRRKQNLPSAAAAAPPHYDGRSESHPPMNADEEFDKGTSLMPPSLILPSLEHSIKLGLGDFVFYSVLVSRAATYGFAAFVSCSLVILGVLYSSHCLFNSL